MFFTNSMNLVIIVVSQHNFFLISNHNYRMQLFFKLLLEHVHGVVVMAIQLLIYDVIVSQLYCIFTEIHE